MELTDLLANDGYIIINKKLIQKYGLEEALIIGELAAEYNYHKIKGELLEDNSFYSTVENIQKNTSLSQYQQSKAINNLSKEGLVEVYYKGIPPKRYIIQHFENLFDLYRLKNLTFKDKKTSSLKIKKLDTNNNNINNNNIKENINKRKKEFIPPTLEEVKEYIKQKSYNVNGEVFYKWYTERKWKDSNNRPVKNWKGKVITWHNNADSKPKDSNFTSRKYDNLNELFMN